MKTENIWYENLVLILSSQIGYQNSVENPKLHRKWLKNWLENSKLARKLEIFFNPKLARNSEI